MPNVAYGEELSAAAGRLWQNSRGPARKLATDRANTIYVVPASELAKWERAGASVDDDWVKEVGARGLDGRALIESARTLLRRHDSTGRPARPAQGRDGALRNWGCAKGGA